MDEPIILVVFDNSTNHCEGCGESFAGHDLTGPLLPVVFEMECVCGQGHPSFTEVYHRKCLTPELEEQFLNFQKAQAAQWN